MIACAPTDSFLARFVREKLKCDLQGAGFCARFLSQLFSPPIWALFRGGRWRGLGDDFHPVIEPQNKIFVCQTPPAKAVIWVGKITGVKISENWNRVLEFFPERNEGFSPRRNHYRGVRRDLTTHTYGVVASLRCGARNLTTHTYGVVASLKFRI